MKVLQIFVLILGLTIWVDAQNSLLTGIIYDEKGAVIQYANIKAKDKEGKEYLSVSNEDGIYKIELPVGIYAIDFSANLFETFNIKNYRVSSGYQGKFNLDVALVVAPVGGCGLKELETQRKSSKDKKKKPETIICL